MSYIFYLKKQSLFKKLEALLWAGCTFNLIICLHWLCLLHPSLDSDHPAVHASVQTSRPHHPARPAPRPVTDPVAAGRGSAHFLFSRDGVYHSHSLPEPAGKHHPCAEEQDYKNKRHISADWSSFDFISFVVLNQRKRWKGKATLGSLFQSQAA